MDYSPWAGRLFRRQVYVDVAARGVGIGADLVRFLDQVVDHRAIQSMVRHPQGDIEVETLASGVLAEADPRRNLGVRTDGRARLARHQPQGAQVAGRIARGEELLGVGPAAALAAHFGRNGQANIDLAVVGGRSAFIAASAGGGCVRAIQNFHLWTPYPQPGDEQGDDEEATSFRNNGSVIREFGERVLTIGHRSRRGRGTWKRTRNIFAMSMTRPEGRLRCFPWKPTASRRRSRKRSA